KAFGYPLIGSDSIFSADKALRKLSFVVFKVLALSTTSACWFRADSSLDHKSAPRAFSPISSSQSGTDSLYFLILESSSKRPLILRVGAGSSCFQSGKGIPRNTAHTVNRRKQSARLKGSFTLAISE